MQRLHAESLDIFRVMSDEDWNKKAKSPEGHPVTAWRMLSGMLEHEAHHRGQIYVYLGILGAPAPPLYTLNETLGISQTFLLGGTRQTGPIKIRGLWT